MDSSTLTSQTSLPAPRQGLLSRMGRHVQRPARWSRRHFWKIGFWILTLTTLAWQYENWRGRKFLAQELTRWTAEYGDITQLPAFLPAVPDDSNFFAAPVFETFVVTRTPPPPAPGAAGAAYAEKVRSLTEALPHARFLNVAFPTISMAPGTVEEKEICPGFSLPDVEAWARDREKSGLPRPTWLTDAQWLHSLMPWDPTVGGLVAALSRPESQFLPTAEALHSIGEQMEDPAAIPIPSMSGFFSRCGDLALRARAAAAAGDGVTARELCEVLLRFAEGPSRSRSLIMMLMGIALEGEALKAISAGVGAQCWGVEDLVRLSNQLERLDEEKLIRRGLYSEAFWLHRQPIGKTRSWFRRIIHFPSEVDGFFTFISVQGPSGWIDSNVANHLHQWGTMLTPDIPGDDLVYLNGKMKQGLAGNLNWYARPSSPRDLFAKILMPAISGVPQRALEIQTLRRQLLLAIALDRYSIQNFLQNKIFPPPGEELVPRFISAIPGDPWAPGKPLRYQTGETGERYRLLSIGPKAILAFPTRY